LSTPLFRRQVASENPRIAGELEKLLALFAKVGQSPPDAANAERAMDMIRRWHRIPVGRDLYIAAAAGITRGIEDWLWSEEHSAEIRRTCDAACEALRKECG
jgi:hypothetical protein